MDSGDCDGDSLSSFELRSLQTSTQQEVDDEAQKQSYSRSETITVHKLYDCQCSTAVYLFSCRDMILQNCLRTDITKACTAREKQSKRIGRSKENHPNRSEVTEGCEGRVMCDVTHLRGALWEGGAAGWCCELRLILVMVTASLLEATFFSLREIVCISGE